MAQTDAFKKYLDAGMEFSKLTRSRAEAIVKELVRAGEVQREQRQERVEELLARSRKNTEELMGAVRKELSQQLSSMGIVTKADLKKLEAKVDALSRQVGAKPKPAATKKAAAAKKG
jgi:polyhydroxyalkanoate synthesis regulator phasin